MFFLFFKQKTAYEMRISDWSSDVCSSDLINGRQFDVVVRFQVGTLRYLVLIEVKNRSRKVTAEHIESFVTKARDQNASKTVVVSAAGFQSGAVLVAERHGVDLFTVTFDESKIRLPSEMTYTIIGNYPVDVPRNPI